MLIGTLIALLISVLAAVIIYKLLKKIIHLIYNCLAGIITFWILDILGIFSVNIDVWVILIVSIGGIFGVIAIIILRWIGIPL